LKTLDVRGESRHCVECVGNKMILRRYISRQFYSHRDAPGVGGCR
jgi:hypothetical protein